MKKLSPKKIDLIETRLDEYKNQLQLLHYDEKLDDFIPVGEHNKEEIAKLYQVNAELFGMIESLIFALEERFNAINDDLKDIGEKVL